MGVIADVCSNVETLYVYMGTKSNESLVGIKKVLRALSPTQLYLGDCSRYCNKKIDELHQLVDMQFGNWPCLVSSMSLLQKFLRT